jgi:hypothetical protein
LKVAPTFAATINDRMRYAWEAVAVAGALGLVQTTRLWWRATAAARRLRKLATRARAAEARAARLLEAHGYIIVAEQPVTRWRIGDHEAQVRADYLVQKGSRSYVVEVKSGSEAPSLSSRSTRRQLLEYHCAFATDGVLIVDGEAGTVERVPFALPRGSRWPLAIVTFLLGAACALGASRLLR